MQLAGTQAQADEGWELVHADAKRYPEKLPNVNAESAKVSYALAGSNVEPCWANGRIKSFYIL
jgi:hypothetical protein